MQLAATSRTRRRRKTDAALTEFLDKADSSIPTATRSRTWPIWCARARRAIRIGPSRPYDLYPPVIGLVARLKGPRGSRDVFIPWDQVRRMGNEGVELSSPAVNLQRFPSARGRDGAARAACFDRQVVDLEGRRVVRINDLDLAQRDGVWRLVAVDISPSALLRRMGWARWPGA